MFLENIDNWCQRWICYTCRFLWESLKFMLLINFSFFFFEAEAISHIFISHLYYLSTWDRVVLSLLCSAGAFQTFNSPSTPWNLFIASWLILLSKYPCHFEVSDFKVELLHILGREMDTCSLSVSFIHS